MLEQIGRGRRRAARKNQTGIAKLIEGSYQLIVAARRNQRQQPVGEFPADYGRDFLGDLLRPWAEAVSRAINEACSAGGTDVVDGIAPSVFSMPPPEPPASSTAFVSSSTNSGTPSARSTISAATSAASAAPPERRRLAPRRRGGRSGSVL